MNALELHSFTSIYVGHSVMLQGADVQDMYSQYVLGLTLSGSATMDMDGYPFEVTRGDITITHPSTLQHWKVENAPKWETLYCIFNAQPQWVEWLNLPQQPVGYTKIGLLAEPPIFRLVRQCFKEMIELRDTETTDRLALKLNTIERIILYCRRTHTWQTQPLDRRVQKALKHLVNHLTESITVESLARASGSSRARLAGLFHQQVGLPPMQYLEQLRMNRAAHFLVYTADAISDIARAVGFKDPKHFSKRFRTRTGQTPCEFRNSSPKGLRAYAPLA